MSQWGLKNPRPAYSLVVVVTAAQWWTWHCKPKQTDNSMKEGDLLLVAE